MAPIGLDEEIPVRLGSSQGDPVSVESDSVEVVSLIRFNKTKFSGTNGVAPQTVASAASSTAAAAVPSIEKESLSGTEEGQTTTATETSSTTSTTSGRFMSHAVIGNYFLYIGVNNCRGDQFAKQHDTAVEVSNKAADHFGVLNHRCPFGDDAHNSHSRPSLEAANPIGRRSHRRCVEILPPPSQQVGRRKQ